jgi:hypothetical protein
MVMLLTGDFSPQLVWKERFDKPYQTPSIAISGRGFGRVSASPAAPA